jgi:hypothetical protein
MNFDAFYGLIDGSAGRGRIVDAGLMAPNCPTSSSVKSVVKYRATRRRS